MSDNHEIKLKVFPGGETEAGESVRRALAAYHSSMRPSWKRWLFVAANSILVGAVALSILHKWYELYVVFAVCQGLLFGVATRGEP